MKTYNLNTSDLSLLTQRLPAADGPRLGFSYDDGVLTVKQDTDIATVDAVLADANWRDKMPAGLLQTYIWQSQRARLATGVSVNVNAGTTDAALMVLADGKDSTRADLAMLALYGQTNPTGQKTWIDNNNTVTVLTGAQLVNLATLVGNWITDTYAAIPNIVAGIQSGTITTYAQIDAAFAAITS